MSKSPGRVCIALAKKLQKQFPSVTVTNGDLVARRTTTTIPLLWLPERLYPASGYYRTDFRADCARWEGTVLAVREDGTTYTMRGVYGWQTMSELIKPGELTWHSDDEITRGDPPPG